VDKIFEQTDAFYGEAKYNEAIVLLLENKELFAGVGDIYYASSLYRLGILYSNMGDYAEAERCYLDTTAIYEKALGKEHSYYAILLNNLGLMYQAMGDYAKAEYGGLYKSRAVLSGSKGYL